MDILFNRILIFDGSHCLHKNLCVPNNWEMMNSKGKRTGGIFGVLRSIQKELKEYNYFPIVVFDGHLSKRRLAIHPNYKHHADNLLKESLEQKTEEDLINEEYRIEYSTQRNDLIELLPAFGIPTIRLEDWEGDDIIYILTKLAKNSIVVSDDRDLLQLVSEDVNRKCRVKRAINQEFWDMKKLHEHNVNIAEYIACKAICGDNSDNIPGACPSVGEKTAPGLYKLYECCTKNNIPYPEDEDSLAKVCKQFDIAKRKAYLNFNENQFLANVLLTDLDIVQNEVDENMIRNLYEDVIKVYSNKDIEKINELLEYFEIKTFAADKLLDNVSQLQCLLKIEDEASSSNISETIRQGNFLFGN